MDVLNARLLELYGADLLSSSSSSSSAGGELRSPPKDALVDSWSAPEPSRAPEPKHLKPTIALDVVEGDSISDADEPSMLLAAPVAAVKSSTDLF